MAEKVRIDKWLWSVRIFKSRTMATNACKSGKVKVNESNVKPSSLLEVNQIIEVSKNGYNLKFKSLKLLSKRVGAQIAQACYEDLTPQSELDKFKSWYIGKASAEVRDRGAGRPTKKERRDISEYKDETESWWEDIADELD